MSCVLLRCSFGNRLEAGGQRLSLRSVGAQYVELVSVARESDLEYQVIPFRAAVNSSAPFAVARALFNISDLADGSYSLLVRPLTAGSFNIDVVCAAQRVANTTIQINVVAGKADVLMSTVVRVQAEETRVRTGLLGAALIDAMVECSASTVPHSTNCLLAEVEPNASVTFDIELRDSHGNPRDPSLHVWPAQSDLVALDVHFLGMPTAAIVPFLPSLHSSNAPEPCVLLPVYFEHAAELQAQPSQCSAQLSQDTVQCDISKIVPWIRRRLPYSYGCAANREAPELPSAETCTVACARWYAEMESFFDCCGLQAAALFVPLAVHRACAGGSLAVESERSIRCNASHAIQPLPNPQVQIDRTCCGVTSAWAHSHNHGPQSTSAHTVCWLSLDAVATVAAEYPT